MEQRTLYIGTYDETGGKGLVPLSLRPDGSFEPGEAYPHARNASFGVRHGDLVYLLDEQEEGALGLHRQGADGWRPGARVHTGGAAPCYLALDPAGRRL